MTNKKTYYMLFDKKRGKIVRQENSKELLIFQYLKQAICFRERRLNDYLGRKYIIRKKIGGTKNGL